MLLLKDNDYTTLPEAIEEHSATLIIYPKGNPKRNPQSYAVQLPRISLEELSELKAKLTPYAEIRGVPTYWALAQIEGKQRLFVWPVPAKTTFARFHYFPAMKEI